MQRGSGDRVCAKLAVGLSVNALLLLSVTELGRKESGLSNSVK
ncbi:MAG: hypothetical protein ACI9J3_004045 [Parvicellaceae bacterium]|jgi:hypothetical protein